MHTNDNDAGHTVVAGRTVNLPADVIAAEGTSPKGFWNDLPDQGEKQMTLYRIIGDLIGGFGTKAGAAIGGYVLVHQAYVYVAHVFDPVRQALGH